MQSGYVHAETVINEAASRLGIDNPEPFRLRFTKLIVDAEIKIKTIGSIGYKYYLYEVGSYPFPDGTRLLIPHDLIDSMEVLDKDGCTIDSCEYYVQGTYLRFHPARTEPVIIRYRGVLLDMYGMPIVPLNHQEASICYIIYMYMTTLYNTNKAPRYKYKDAQIEWRDRLGEARGNDMFPDEAGIIEAGQALFNARICKAGQKCCDACSMEDISHLIDEYNADVRPMLYGGIDLPVIVDDPYTITDFLLSTLSSTTKEIAEGDLFFNNITVAQRMIFAVPQDYGHITEMFDSLNNDIFPNYFNLIVDNERGYFVYVSKEFVNPFNYKLKLNFEN